MTDTVRVRESVSSFIVRRVGRIFPALIVCLIVSVFIIGPCFTKLSLKAYFLDPHTASYFYRNLRLGLVQWRLPGVFADSAEALNGALWTLPIEFRLYIVLAVLMLIGSLREPVHASVSLMLCLVALTIWPALVSVDTTAGLRLVRLFFFGGLFGIWKQYIRLNVKTGVVITILSCVFLSLNSIGEAKFDFFYLSIGYWMLFVFTREAVLRISFPGDYSYGVYIYGFPIQQSIHSVMPMARPIVAAGLAMVICILLGAMSWHALEKPSMGFAQRIALRLEPAHGAPDIPTAAPSLIHVLIVLIAVFAGPMILTHGLAVFLPG